MTQRVPTDQERDHLAWIHEQVGKIQSLLGLVPHEVAVKIIYLTNEIEGAVFDPFGEIMAGCEVCEGLILTCDEDAVSGDDGWCCGACFRAYNKEMGR